jgi:hypothetical protein
LNGTYRKYGTCKFSVLQALDSHISLIHLIEGPLTNIYNVSLSSGVFPDKWKLVKVKSLYKKGDRYDIQNYRPISIISLFAQLLERLMFNRGDNFSYMKIRF